MATEYCLFWISSVEAFCMEQSVWAAWIQAIGSIGAIGAATWIASSQARSDREQARHSIRIVAASLMDALRKLKETCSLQDVHLLAVAAREIDEIVQMARSVRIELLDKDSFYAAFEIRKVAAAAVRIQEMPDYDGGWEAARDEADRLLQEILMAAYGFEGDMKMVRAIKHRASRGSRRPG